MFCSNCGQKVQETAKFCSRCGHPLHGASSASQNAPSVLPLVLPVYKNISLTITSPYVLWLDRQNCAFIRIEPSFLAQITGNLKNESEKGRAFLSFANTLRSKPLDHLLSEYTGSLSFDNAQITKFHIDTYFDVDWHKLMPYARFRLVITNAGKHRGSIDIETYSREIQSLLRSLLGSRYSTREFVEPSEKSTYSNIDL